MTEKIIARVALSPDDYYNILWALDELGNLLDKRYGGMQTNAIKLALARNQKSICKTMKTVERGLKV